MNSITKIENLTAAFDPASPKKSPYDQSLATLESFIDKMVTAENNVSKANAQTAIQRAQLLQDYERKIAFMTGQIHRAESELASVEGSAAQSSQTLGANPVLDAKKQEVLYWKAQLRQTIESNELNNSL